MTTAPRSGRRAPRPAQPEAPQADAPTKHRNMAEGRGVAVSEAGARRLALASLRAGHPVPGLATAVLGDAALKALTDQVAAEQEEARAAEGAARAAAAGQPTEETPSGDAGGQQSGEAGQQDGGGSEGSAGGNQG